MIEIIDVEDDREPLVRSILQALPEWFGVPASVDEYARTAGHLPMLAAKADGPEPIGFLSLRRESPVAWEAYVLGVRRDWHRCGVGRMLFSAAERRLREEGAHYLTVKTLSDKRPNPYYEATRRFYQAIGFEPLAEFPTLWGRDNPCLLLIKPLSPPH